MTDNALMISNYPPRIFERDYVEGVLGIRLPLNEAAPYSAQYRRRIIEEQLQLEGFFKSFKKLTGGLKQAALGIRYIVEDPSRIKDFVQAVMDTANEQYDKFMKWISTVLKVAKKVFDSYKVKAMKMIGQFAQKLRDSLKAVWEKTNAMAGWQSALFAIVASVSIKYAWDQIVNAGGEELTDEAKAKEIMAALGEVDGDIAKLESITYPTPSLITALYDTNTDERLDEFIKSLKKAASKVKDKFKKVSKDAKKIDKASDGKMSKAAKKKAKGAAKDTAKDALKGGKDDDGDDQEKDDEEKGEKSEKDLDEGAQSYLSDMKKTFKKLMGNLGKSFIKNMAVDAIAGALSGGVATAFKYMGKLFKGVKYVLKVIGEPMNKFVSQIENAKEEAKEAEAGEDDPTDEKTKKEAYVRAYVRQILREEYYESIT